MPRNRNDEPDVLLSRPGDQQGAALLLPSHISM